MKAIKKAGKKKKTGITADKETLHSTDPQDLMRGPMSDSVQLLEKVFDQEKNTEKKKDM